MRTYTLGLTALAGLALAGTTVLQARNAGRVGQAVPPAAPAAPRGVAAEGRVVAYPGAEVQVAAERGGRLERVLVTEGQSVRKGQLLGELESAELRASVQAARARVAEADAEVHLGEQNLERKRRLAEERIAAPLDLDQARRDLDTARARRETAVAEVGLYEAQLRKTRIVAPISGTVTARTVDAGETLETGQPVAIVADLGRLRVDAEADEADAAALAVGAPVTIRADGYPGQSWPGRVEEVADSVTLRKLKPQDPGRPTDTRILAVKVAFAEKAPLKLGTTVELQITPPQDGGR
jgi:RND family efflux transporter MFP subunit